MGIYDQVNADMKTAMRARDKARLAALRNIRAVFIEALKTDNADTLADAACEKLLRRLAKQRQESIRMYSDGGRADLADAERAELAIIDAYLPKLADEPTTRAWVTEAIAATGAAAPKDMGRVMGHLMKHHKAVIDGKLANRLVREALAG